MGIKFILIKGTVIKNLIIVLKTCSFLRLLEYYCFYEVYKKRAEI
jgi:hypothetical protein